MSDYRRWFVPGGTYFFTVVTYLRRPILTARLRGAASARRFMKFRANGRGRRWRSCSFRITSIRFGPCHRATAATPSRWQKVKETFTRKYLSSGGYEGRGSLSRKRHGERAVWQRRFWEHTCRDEEDMKLCADYLHWNPVKHALLAVHSRIAGLPFIVSSGWANTRANWGGVDPCAGFEMPE